MKSKMHSLNLHLNVKLWISIGCLFSKYIEYVVSGYIDDCFMFYVISSFNQKFGHKSRKKIFIIYLNTCVKSLIKLKTISIIIISYYLLVLHLVFIDFFKYLQKMDQRISVEHNNIIVHFRNSYPSIHLIILVLNNKWQHCSENRT